MELKLGKKPPRRDVRTLKMSSFWVEEPPVPEAFDFDEANCPSLFTPMFANDRYGNCFVGDTKVPLLNGKEYTIKELSEGSVKLPFWVYSLDENKNIVPGKVTHVGLTRKHAKLVKVILDNHKEIRCTEDHLFLTRKNVYVKASDLRAGASLMPLYRDYEFNGYERVYNPRTGKRPFTHKVVFKAVHGRGVLDDFVIHHWNCNKTDNSPDNLKELTVSDHMKFHFENGKRLITYAKSRRGRRKSGAIMRQVMSNPEVKERILKKKERGFLNWVANGGRTGFARWDAKKLSKFNSDKGKRNAAIGICNLSHTMSHTKHVSWNSGRTKGDDPRIKGNVGSDNGMFGKCPHNKGKHSSKWSEASKRGWERRRQAMLNHRVVSVEHDGYADVYDLTVENFHNFAVSAGVFVHNCVIAARAHMTLRFEVLERHGVIHIGEENVVDQYFKESGGYDGGLVMLDSLNDWRKNGWVLNDRFYNIYAYGYVSPYHPQDVRIAVCHLGGLYTGVMLPECGRKEYEEGRTWESLDDSQGVWGGHCMLIVGYDLDTVTFITWGRKQKATWNWFSHYTDEAYAVIDNRDAFLGEESPVDIYKMTSYLNIVTR